jgi:hypothetical protein
VIPGVAELVQAAAKLSEVAKDHYDRKVALMVPPHCAKHPEFDLYCDRCLEEADRRLP